MIQGAGVFRDPSALFDFTRQYKIVNVRDYGAKGDTVLDSNGNYISGTDDTAAIQNAMDSNPNCLIYFPGASSKYGAKGLTVNSKGLRLVGESRYGTQLVYTGADGGALISLGTFSAAVTNYWVNHNVHDLWVENMILYNSKYANMASNGSRKSFGIQDNGAGGVRLKNVLFNGFEYGMCGAYGSDFTRGEDVDFVNNDVGLYLGPGSQQNYFARLNFWLNNEGMVLDSGASQGKMDNCYFIDNYKQDISIEANSTTRLGVSGTGSGISNDLAWSGEDMWFETGAGYNPNSDHQWHIHTSGNQATYPRGFHLKRVYLVSGTTGMGAKQTGEKYSFCRVDSGLYFTIDDMIISGNRIDVVCDIGAPQTSFVQRNVRTQDGYTTIPNWNNQIDGCVVWDFYGRTKQGRTNDGFMELDDNVTGQNFKLVNNGDGTIGLQVYISGAWRYRAKIDVGNSRLYLGDQSGTPNMIAWGTAAPTSGSYNLGDIVFNKGTPGTNTGWKCTTAGSPGTWTTF